MDSRRCSDRDARFIVRPLQRAVGATFRHTAHLGGADSPEPQVAASGLVCFLRGSLIALCGAVLIKIGALSSEAWLRSVSSTRNNFSASTAMTFSSLAESTWLRFNHSHELVAIDFMFSS